MSRIFSIQLEIQVVRGVNTNSSIFDSVEGEIGDAILAYPFFNGLNYIGEKSLVQRASRRSKNLGIMEFEALPGISLGHFQFHRGNFPGPSVGGFGPSCGQVWEGK